MADLQTRYDAAMAKVTASTAEIRAIQEEVKAMFYTLPVEVQLTIKADPFWDAYAALGSMIVDLASAEMEVVEFPTAIG
jgi:hypothetical protein